MHSKPDKLTSVWSAPKPSSPSHPPLLRPLGLQMPALRTGTPAAHAHSSPAGASERSPVVAGSRAVSHAAGKDKPPTHPSRVCADGLPSSRQLTGQRCMSHVAGHVTPPPLWEVQRLPSSRVSGLHCAKPPSLSRQFPHFPTKASEHHLLTSNPGGGGTSGPPSSPSLPHAWRAPLPAV